MGVTKANITTHGAKVLTYPIQVENLIICQLLEHLQGKSESLTLLLMSERQGKQKVIKKACNAN